MCIFKSIKERLCVLGGIKEQEAADRLNNVDI